MINKLLKVADTLDSRGLHKEASEIDTLVKKACGDYCDGCDQSGDSCECDGNCECDGHCKEKQ